MRLPDAQRSRAILIGTASYADTSLEDLPATVANVTALQSLLADPDSGGFRVEHCSSMIDPDRLDVVGPAIDEIARETEDTLVVYYAGHGLVDEDGELFLGLRNTNRAHLDYTSLPFSSLRRAFRKSMATNRVLILDCCFSGRAIEAMSDPASVVGGQLDLSGVYTLTSTSATKPARAPKGAKYTAFTGELVKVLRQGISGGPELLTLSEIYPHLSKGMQALGLPLPQQRGTNTVQQLALTRNPAPAQTQSENSPFAPETEQSSSSAISLCRSARQIIEMSQSGSLIPRLQEHHMARYGQKVSTAEERSWQKSLVQLARDLDDIGLGDVELIVEYPLPLSSLRADVVLAGYHPDTGQSSYVVVELKQWSNAQIVPDAPDLCTVPHAPGRYFLHPARQVQQYRSYIMDFVRTLENRTDAITGVAYLHNAETKDVSTLVDTIEEKHGLLFTRTTRDALLSFLYSRFAPTSGSAAAQELINSKVAPSRQLMAVAADEIRNREQFTLLDQQQTAYSLVLAAVNRSREADRKEVIVVTGGPGSGKSVIALSVLGELNRRGYGAMHATGSRSFTTTLRKTAGRGSTRVKNLFQYFRSFMHAGRNDLDVLICDEAHRIKETSNNRFTAAAKRSDKRQLDELLDAAKVPVFLLDEHQVVRPGELGTVEEIEQAARERNLPVQHVELNGQFRCGGSRKYEQWVLKLLELEGYGPIPWTPEPQFELLVADTPAELEELLSTKNHEGHTARMTAGFCWPWSDPTKHGTLVDDVVIGNWRRPWNVKGDRRVGEAPESSLWATDPGGFGQIGCIYTAQGFEYDWNGVIFGPDMVWRDNQWVTDRSASKDNVVARARGEDYDRLIRNTYKVLLTRGMVGTILYSTDSETRAKIRSLIQE